MTDQPNLHRVLGLPRLILYGTGTMLGAGIYALVGEAAAIAGWQAPLGFLLAGLLAFLTALSFAEMCSRFPKSAGPAVYVAEGFLNRHLSRGVGLAVALSGIVSAGALANAFAGYLSEFVALPGWLASAAFVLSIGAVAAWGIAESATIAAIITLIEASGLGLILWVAGENFADISAHMPALVWPQATAGRGWIDVLSAGVLAFYAFIGFEDMVNVAEETRRPRTTLPAALLIALFLTTLLYLAVTTVSVLTVTPDDLAQSRAPLTRVYQVATGKGGQFISIVSLFAIVNGAIIQIIMASRVLYGMADSGWLPPVLSQVHRRTRTPLVATALVTWVVLILALGFDLGSLARATSLILLGVFTLVNAALVRIKRRAGSDEPPFSVPIWLPVVGLITSSGVIAFEVVRILSL